MRDYHQHAFRTRDRAQGKAVGLTRGHTACQVASCSGHSGPLHSCLDGEERRLGSELSTQSATSGFSSGNCPGQAHVLRLRPLSCGWCVDDRAAGRLSGGDLTEGGSCLAGRAGGARPEVRRVRSSPGGWNCRGEQEFSWRGPRSGGWGWGLSAPPMRTRGGWDGEDGGRGLAGPSEHAIWVPPPGLCGLFGPLRGWDFAFGPWLLFRASVPEPCGGRRVRGS